MPRKAQLREVPIFPMSCEKGHNFQPLVDEDNQVRGYYKRDSNGDKANPNVYGMLYCNKCGDTKEIVIVNKGD